MKIIYEKNVGIKMEVIALLRGVTPIGKNRIPKMSFLTEILSEVGFEDVRTYIQSGNILLKTNLSIAETKIKIHETIKERIGADLAIIIKTKTEFKKAIEENPFDDTFDYSRIHLVFTNDIIDKEKLREVSKKDYFGEVFEKGSHCLYMYLPREAPKKKLNTNYLEKQLGIRATMRKLNVIGHLFKLANEEMG